MRSRSLGKFRVALASSFCALSDAPRYVFPSLFWRRLIQSVQTV